MAVVLQCDNFPLTEAEVQDLWQATSAHQQYGDAALSVRCVAEDEMTALNREYRGQPTATNVLTFSYSDGSSVSAEQERLVVPSEHDVALCLEVAEREAGERRMTLRDYVALLLVHAFLHATGLDHERSAEDARAGQRAEKKILRAAGFADEAL